MDTPAQLIQRATELIAQSLAAPPQQAEGLRECARLYLDCASVLGQNPAVP